MSETFFRKQTVVLLEIEMYANVVNIRFLRVLTCQTPGVCLNSGAAT
jgi:hypothetical protein